MAGSYTSLCDLLNEWVAGRYSNGIKQHDKAWYQARVNTISGSILSTLMGLNPYQKLPSLISEKLGISVFKGDIKTRWGSLFEDVLRDYVERDRQCKIVGENLFIEAPGNISYSPDGLTVLSTTPHGCPEIMLCEFKCPFSRIPSGGPPKYYIPQVKMGLDMLKLPTRGLFAEAVFRRCGWDHLDNSPVHDTKLVSTEQTLPPLAIGVIGFYLRREQVISGGEDINTTNTTIHTTNNTTNTQFFNTLNDVYSNVYAAKGYAENGYHSNDLGECPVSLFKLIIEAFDRKILSVYYAPVVVLSVHVTEAEYCTALNEHLASYTAFCETNDHINYGLLPWKLFTVNYNYIEKEDGYLAPWMDKISEVIGFIKHCNETAESMADKLMMYNTFVRKYTGEGFEDD